MREQTTVDVIDSVLGPGAGSGLEALRDTREALKAPTRSGFRAAEATPEQRTE